MPGRERQRQHGAASSTPYIFSEAELKRLLAAVPAATGTRSEIDADTLRTFLLLRGGGPILIDGIKAMDETGTPPPRTVIGDPSQAREQDRKP